MVASVGSLSDSHFTILQINVCNYLACASLSTKGKDSAALVLLKNHLLSLLTIIKQFLFSVCKNLMRPLALEMLSCKLLSETLV